MTSAQLFRLHFIWSFEEISARPPEAEKGESAIPPGNRLTQTPGGTGDLKGLTTTLTLPVVLRSSVAGTSARNVLAYGGLEICQLDWVPLGKIKREKVGVKVRGGKGIPTGYWDSPLPLQLKMVHISR